MLPEHVGDGLMAWATLLEKYDVKSISRFVQVHHAMLEAKMDKDDPDQYFHKIDEMRSLLSEMNASKEDEMIRWPCMQYRQDWRICDLYWRPTRTSPMKG